MKRAGVILLMVQCAVPTLLTAQQPRASNPQSLVITDKAAVQEWSQATHGQQPDAAKDPAGDTQFLLSLSDTELYGAFRFKQRCDACHGLQMSLAPNTWGPQLSKRNVEGREDAVRRQISEGSARMPAFKYALQPSDIEAIIAYLKKVDTTASH
jgi:mono/diheme cytochrome c family protein